MPLAEILGCTVNSALLSLLTRNVSVWLAWPAGPGEMLVAQFATVCKPAYTVEAKFGPWVKVGGWLIGKTVMTNVTGEEVVSPPFAVLPLLDRVTVTVALPCAPGAVS